MARRKDSTPAVPVDPREEMLQAFLALAALPEEERKVQVAELKARLTPEQIAGLKELQDWLENSKILVAQSRTYNLDGYKAFYKLMHGFYPPAHIEAEVKAILDSADLDKGVEILASRGSWKTTSIALTFVPWFIGHHPDTASLIIQANDASANATALAVSETVRIHPGFRQVFPHVVPYPEKKWSEDGYEVRLTHTDYTCTTEVSLGEWTKRTAARKDPTLLALSYSSKSVVGKHPTGLFLIDDIHDEENTKSQAQLDDVLAKLKGTILPMVFSLRDESAPVGKQLLTTIVAVGTPWVEGDAMQYLRETGEFEVYEFPVLSEVSQDTPGAVRIDHVSKRGEELKGWFRFNWPEKFGPNAALAAFNTSGEYDFWRMYLLLFKAKKGEGVRFTLFPAHMIDASQDAAATVDYASIRAEMLKETKNRSRFCHMVAVKLPTLNKVVIKDVYSEFVTQLQAETQIERGQNLYPQLRGTYLEIDGKGEEFYQTLKRKPHLRIIPTSTKGLSKERRHEVGLNPWLEMGQLLVSDENTPGLNRLRTALTKWPHGSTDEMDAAYYIIRAFPEVFHLPDTTKPLTPRAMQGKQIRNPWITSFQRT